ncbi:MAG: MATE family efflux transporter, partial [Halobacteriaceae archaeon]
DGASFLRYVSLSFGFIGIMRAFTGGFRGAGKTLIAAIISIATLGGIRLPVAYVGSQFIWGVEGIWIAFAVSNVAGAIIAWGWFQRGTWREGDVRGQPGPRGMETENVNSTTTDD